MAAARYNTAQRRGDKTDMQALREFWDSFLHGLLNSLPGGNDLAQFLIQLLKLVLIGGITLWAARRLRRWGGGLLGRARVASNVTALLGNAIFALTVVLGLTWLLAALGATWAAVLASLSVVTVALGLALQDLLKNFVAGVYLLVEQPFKIGDQIVVKGVGGEVEGVDIRTTVLRTEEGLRVLVPNNVVFTEVVTNRSAYDTRRVALQLADAQVDFNELNSLVNEALAPFDDIVRPPAPKVTIQKVNDGSATIGLEYWQRGAGANLSEVIARLKECFPAATITVMMADGIKVGAP
jgi:small conductance mechanosensitive channel